MMKRMKMPNKDKAIQKLMSFVQKEESEEEDVDEDLEDRMKGDEQTYHGEEAVGFPVIPTGYLDVADDPQHWRHSSKFARPKRVNIVDEGSHPSWESAPSLIPDAKAGIEAFPEVSGEPHSDTPGKWPTLIVPSKQAYERDEGPATPRSYKPIGGPSYMGRGNVKNSIQKLMGFVQIQKIGYTTQPGSEYESGPERSKELVPQWEIGGMTPQGEFPSEAVKKIGRDIGNQSFGLPAMGSKAHEKILDTMFDITGVSPGYDEGQSDPLEDAHYYLNSIKNQHGVQGSPGHNFNEVDMHMKGHRALATVHNVMTHGEDYLDHPDAIKYFEHKVNPDHSFEESRAARNRGEDYDVPYYSYTPPMEGVAHSYNGRPYAEIEGVEEMTIPLEEYHRAMVNGHVYRRSMSNVGLGMADELHRKIRMESPMYDPEAEQAYYLSHWPEGEYTGTPELGARRAEEGVGQPMRERGREVTEGEKHYQAIIDRNKERNEIGEDIPNLRHYFNTLEERRRFHDTRESPPELEGYTGRRERHAVDRRLSDEFNAARGWRTTDLGQERQRKANRSNPKIKDAFERKFPELYNPEEKAVAKLEKFMRKEGAVGGEGGGFDGLSDTVFTSTNAGIFTPTYGGKGTKKKYNRNHKRQDAKRRKLMGKEKKSGVERLVQYLYDGSPHLAKAGKMGLAPGLDDSMTGDAPTAHAGKNRVHSPMRLNWKKDVEDDTLNHKRTSRPLEDATEVAIDNEPHISMGQPGGFETGTTATLPVKHSNVNSVGNPGNPRAPVWGKDNSYVQKAVNGVTTMISPDGNSESADGPHPQKTFIERGGDNPNEAPHKDAVIKENDMQRKRKQESNTEPEGSQPVAGLGLQMSSFGMNTYEQDALARGGEEDESHDEEDIDESQRREDEDGNMWIPMNPDRTKSLESMRKALEDAGDEAPLLTALHKLDHS